MRATDEQIVELKGKYPELYKVTRKDNDYIFRMPTLQEWKEARRKDNIFSTKDKIVQSCLVFPALSEMRAAEKTDGYLVEVLGTKIMSYILLDDEGDDGERYVLPDGTEGFRISRKGKTYEFRAPTRAEWKRIVSMLEKDGFGAMEYLLSQCKLNLSDAELHEVASNDVAFIERVGGPFIQVVGEDLMDAEGKKI